jgi:hypothetical protein
MTLSRRTEQRSATSRRSGAKTFLLAFGPLLVLTALGLIGARVASVDTREAVRNGRTDWETQAFVGDRHVREDEHRRTN